MEACIPDIREDVASDAIKSIDLIKIFETADKHELEVEIPILNQIGIMTMCLFRKVSKTKLSTARYMLRENIREQHPTLPIPKNSYCTAENILTMY